MSTDFERVIPGSPDNEERRLLAEYETTTHFYSWAISELSRQREILPQDACDKLLKLVEEARRDCEKARLALGNVKQEKSSYYS